MTLSNESPRSRPDRFELGVGETLDFSVDWGSQYLGAGETISDSTWSGPASLTLTGATNTTTLAKVFATWDTGELADPIGKTVELVNEIETTEGVTIRAVMEIVGVKNTGKAFP